MKERLVQTFNDIDETIMYEYGENDNIRYGNYNINKASLIRNMKLDELCLIIIMLLTFDQREE